MKPKIRIQAELDIIESRLAAIRGAGLDLNKATANGLIDLIAGCTMEIEMEVKKLRDKVDYIREIVNTCGKDYFKEEEV